MMNFTEKLECPKCGSEEIAMHHNKACTEEIVSFYGLAMGHQEMNSSSREVLEHLRCHCIRCQFDLGEMECKDFKDLKAVEPLGSPDSILELLELTSQQSLSRDLDPK